MKQSPKKEIPIPQKQIIERKLAPNPIERKTTFKLFDLSIDRYDKRKVHFVKSIANVPTRIKTRKIKSPGRYITFKNHTFEFDIAKPAYRIRNIFYYIVDIDKGQICFPEAAINASAPELLDKIVRRSLAKQLVSSVEKMPLSEVLLYILLSVGMGAGLGYILGNFFPMG